MYKNPSENLIRLLPVSMQGVLNTARRAGIKRTMYRLERLLRLKVLNPCLGEVLYPVPSLGVHSQRNSYALNVLKEIVELRSHCSVAQGWDVNSGKLSLLNQSPILLKPPVPWHVQLIEDPLWGFRLHGWDWLWSVLLVEESNQVFFTLWKDWLSKVKTGKGLAWEPEPTSRRLIAWLAAWYFLYPGADLLAHIIQHARYLKRHIEKDLDNNHLIANIKALAWVEILFQDVVEDLGEWFPVFLNVFDEQVREDGTHMENSTSYHVSVWLDVLETVYLALSHGKKVSKLFIEKLIKMGDFVQSLRHPNGTLPLLNDSIGNEPVTLDLAFNFESLVLEKLSNLHSENYFVDRSVHTPSRAFPESGYVVLKSGSEKEGTYLLFDAGDLGPIHVLGHGHADTLSFELWSRGRPLILDPGTFQYPAGKWRDYFRSTAAHSTAVIDGVDQSLFVGSFRVAHAARGRLVSCELNENPQEIVGEHNGYLRLPDPVCHRRSIRLYGCKEIVIKDDFWGKKTHHIDLIFHLSPLSTVEIAQNHAKVSFDKDIKMEILIEGCEKGFFYLKEGWISPTWYKKIPSPSLVFSFDSILPLSLRTHLKIND